MRIGHVHVQRPAVRDGRWGFDDYSQGQRQHGALPHQSKSVARATDLAVLLANGRGDLLQINAGELAEFRQWKAECQAQSDACRCLRGVCRT